MERRTRAGTDGAGNGGAGADVLAANLAKWSTLPSGGPDQARVEDLLALSDADFAEFWRAGSAKWTAERGWEYERFGARFAGLRVLEIGSGLGHDGLALAPRVRNWTFCDILAQNLTLVRRAARLLGVRNVSFQQLHDPLAHDFRGTFGAFWAHGVLHHLPFALARREMANIDRFLAVGAVAGVLMYPRERWEAAGRPPFGEFGARTDGPGTPWAEWYDEDKILALFGPAWALRDTVHWGSADSRFVTFELVKERETPDEQPGDGAEYAGECAGGGSCCETGGSCCETGASCCGSGGSRCGGSGKAGPGGGA
jgi:SAM-dependent methyltransferase